MQQWWRSISTSIEISCPAKILCEVPGKSWASAARLSTTRNRPTVQLVHDEAPLAIAVFAVPRLAFTVRWYSLHSRNSTAVYYNSAALKRTAAPGITHRNTAAAKGFIRLNDGTEEGPSIHYSQSQRKRAKEKSEEKTSWNRLRTGAHCSSQWAAVPERRARLTLGPSYSLLLLTGWKKAKGSVRRLSYLN